MYDFDDFDEEFDADTSDESEDEELREREAELREREAEIREAAEDLQNDIRDEIRDQARDIAENSRELDQMRKELEEIRKMKEELRKELDEVRKEREARRVERRLHHTVRPPRPPKPVRPPKRATIVDLEALTDSLEDMMEGLGEQIRTSFSGLKVLGKEIAEPFLDIKTAKRHIKHKKKGAKSRFEDIPPERIASVITPLASEERLRILDYLKTGGKTFNELETHTGKTGSSLTHHLNPLLDAGYVIKGEVRGMYYISVEGQLAYRLAQWLTERLEREIRLKDVKEAKANEEQDDTDGEVRVIIEDDEEDEFD